MTPVFADTEYWIALNSPHDDLHARVVAVTNEVTRRPVVTSEMVLTEFLDGCAPRGEFARRVAVGFVRGLLMLNTVQVIPNSPTLFGDALTLYESRIDKDWSLTDCASMLVCNQLGIIDVLTHDYHFVQAGLRALLRESSAT